MKFKTLFASLAVMCFPTAGFAAGAREDLRAAAMNAEMALATDAARAWEVSGRFYDGGLREPASTAVPAAGGPSLRPAFALGKFQEHSRSATKINNGWDGGMPGDGEEDRRNAFNSLRGYLKWYYNPTSAFYDLKVPVVNVVGAALVGTMESILLVPFTLLFYAVNAVMSEPS